MRIAYLYDDKNIYIEFSDEKFRELLIEYFEKTKDISKSLDRIEQDLRDAIKYK